MLAKCAALSMFCTFLTITSAFAQPVSKPVTGRTQPRPAGEFQPRSREEINALYAEAQRREDAENERRAKLMAHWTYAVCVGCGAAPKPFRAVVTNPVRVLAGIPAWMDDERAAGRRTAARGTLVRRRVVML